MTAAGVSQTELDALIAGLTQPPAAATVVERCAVMDLPVDSCAHCRPTPAQSDDDGPKLGPWITARYKGECSGCGDPFEVLDRIRADGVGGWLAECCGLLDIQPSSSPAAGSLDGLIANAVSSLEGAFGAVTPVAAPAAAFDPSCYRCQMGDPCSGNHQTAEEVYGIGYESRVDQLMPSPPPSTVAETAAAIEAAKANQPPEYLLIVPTATPGVALTMPTAAPDHDKPHPPTGGPPPSTVAEMREVLTQLDANRPRSLQTRLGPSELGTPCQRQIAMKLVGIQRQPEDKRPPWAPMQGTAMHTLMEEALRFHNAQLGRERWIVEEKLVVDPGLPGSVDPITGHGDAFDTDAGMVVDWKYVGVTALRDVKRKTIANDQLVKPEYRVQAHLYGRGHERAGRRVRHVRLVFLARSHDYADSAEWTEEYRPDIAEWAVDRYMATHDLIDGLGLADNPHLWGLVPAAPGKACDWCPFRRVGGPADATGCPGNTTQKIDKQVSGLIA